MANLMVQLRGYRLTTAEILYHMPDAPSVLQTFVWQEYDRDPDFPRLHTFLEFWERNLDGKLHSVKVAATPLVQPSDFRHARDYLVH